MSTQQRRKAPWVHRFAIVLWTSVLAILIYWLLGFLVNDIQAIPGPNMDAILDKRVDPVLTGREIGLSEEIGRVDRSIADKRDEMRIVRDNSQNQQSTMNQLIQLRRLAVEKSAEVSEAEQENMSRSLAHFLQNQNLYQKHNAELAALAERKRALGAERTEVKKQLDAQRATAKAEYYRLWDRHRMRLAGLQLVVLLPLLAVGAFLLAKKRGSIYFPLFLAYSGATLVKVTLVIHEYFPSRYFKYGLILGLLFVVARLLIHFIRQVAFPRAQWLMKQYREAYERFLCPVCEYPIRTGPRRYLFWTRRTVHKIVLPGGAGEEEVYACPACGTLLFEECPECHGVRHSLLPHCRHCNAETTVVDDGERTEGDSDQG